MSAPGEPTATPAEPEAVLPLRDLYRREMTCQIVRDSWHARGWTDAYLLRLGSEVAGYGLVGGAGRAPRTAVIEFHVLPPHRGRALALFDSLLAASGARTIEAQSNDRLLTLMSYDRARRIRSDTILFEDAVCTRLAVPGAVFRPVAPGERDGLFAHTVEPVGNWAIEAGGEVVATGGFLLHYNPPYADLYMEVAGPHRRRGYGSLLVQELKRVAREAGHTPGARCRAANIASRAALQKAGMFPCARLLTGVVAR